MLCPNDVMTILVEDLYCKLAYPYSQGYMCSGKIEYKTPLVPAIQRKVPTIKRKVPAQGRKVPATRQKVPDLGCGFSELSLISYKNVLKLTWNETL